MQNHKNLAKKNFNYKPKGLWFFGMSGSGKTFASNYIKKFVIGSFLIDGDEIREKISFDLGYTLKDRKIQVKRVLGIAKICVNQGLYPIISTVYFDKKLLSSVEKIRISLIEIQRNDEIVNFKIRNEKNIVGKDILQEEIKCNKIINDINFESKLRGLIL